MRLIRLHAVVPVVACLALISACSGDDGDGGSPDDAASSSDAGGEGGEGTGEGGEGGEGGTLAPGEQSGGTQTRSCTVEVDVTGAVAKSWTGEASVRLQDLDQETAAAPKAVYRSSKGNASFTVYSSGPQFDASLTFAVGQVGYAGPPSGKTDINASGKGAVVDQSLASAQGDEVQVNAEFTCAKPGKGGKKKKG